MKKLLVGLAAVPFLVGIAMAGQPMPLSDAQMDKVTAGQSLEIETGVTEINFGPTELNVQGPGHVEDTANALGGLVCGTRCMWFNS
jgi:hypothetical protein